MTGISQFKRYRARTKSRYVAKQVADAADAKAAHQQHRRSVPEGQQVGAVPSASQRGARSPHEGHGQRLCEYTVYTLPRILWHLKNTFIPQSENTG